MLKEPVSDTNPFLQKEMKNAENGHTWANTKDTANISFQLESKNISHSIF